MMKKASKLIFTNLKSNSNCSMITRGLTGSSPNFAKNLVYAEYGEPVDVLKIRESEDLKPTANQVAVKWKFAPVNPADINIIQGKYPVKPQLPAVGGNEGVGEIVDVGEGIGEFQVGDRVVPNRVNELGTWRTRGVYSPEQLVKIPGDFTDIEASMLNVNPGTAYRMLRDFGNLTPGDTVIQNAANSAVGRFVIQLCKAWNLNSVNVVRERDNYAQLKDELINLGATEVITESEARTTKLFKNKVLPAPKLALNCVCGDSGLNVLRLLARNGVIVTYGAMSREPLSVPASALIFKDIVVRGFWMSEWAKRHQDAPERLEMMNHIGQLYASKKLRAPPHKLIPFNNYKEAVEETLKLDGKTGVKYILDMTV